MQLIYQKVQGESRWPPARSEAGADTLSGVGRVGGRYAMETLTEPQTVVIG
jgi:hypothetical protein